MAIIKCLWCGKQVEGNKNKKYCCRSCQQKASRNRQKQGINTLQHICKKCGKTFIIKDNGYSRRYCYDCVPQIPKSGAENRKIIKKWALEYKGSKCAICGYNKCNSALEFHHLDTSKKDFCISDRNLILDWNLIKEELDKCILVCSNCHREIHEKEHKNG